MTEVAEPQVGFLPCVPTSHPNPRVRRASQGQCRHRGLGQVPWGNQTPSPCHAWHRPRHVPCFRNPPTTNQKGSLLGWHRCGEQAPSWLGEGWVNTPGGTSWPPVGSLHGAHADAFVSEELGKVAGRRWHCPCGRQGPAPVLVQASPHRDRRM